MGLLDKIQSMFKSVEKVDIAQRFELLSEGFVGTMSRFYKAHDRKLGKIVGLKLCDIEKTSQFEARFPGLKKPSEGEIAMSMKNERIVETYEYGVSSKGQGYIVMEYLPGPGLQQLVRQKDQKLLGNRVELIREMAQAIHAVHEAGYIHRDVCPRNFICSEDRASLKLIDFGLTLPDEPVFRQPGNRTGTPMYMAPEIVRRRQTDRRVDVFALGVTAYELLAFQLPWPHAEATGKGALEHDNTPPVPLVEVVPEVNPELAAAIHDCMKPNPDQRPRSLDAFLQRIRRIKHSEQ